MATLNAKQIDYLLQIKNTVPPLPERTVRIMLRALRWSPEEVEHGIQFLELPPAPEDAMAPAPIIFTEPVEPAPKTASIKQNPFPIGSPLLKAAGGGGGGGRPPPPAKRRPVIFGFIVGLVVFWVGVLIYMNLSGAGK